MIVTLTDFGNSEYLGIMKGVIYSICPKARITDLYNDVDPHNIKEGAWILLKNYRYFPKGSIFLCVIDPGVGGRRNAIAIKTKNYYFVGPDNGLMYPTAIEDGTEVVVKLPTGNVSKTFHGRDVFAKAAGELENGRIINDLGKPTEIQTKLEFHLRGRIGEIVRIDRFGNIITNLTSLDKDEYVVKIDNMVKKLRFYETYESAPNDELFLILGSNNTLEISVKNKSAIKKFNVRVGDRIEII